MIIKGFEKLSLSDYPGNVSCVIFTPGCNLACPFCHNSDLVLNSHKLKLIPEKNVFEYLNKRKGLIDGMVITGGEPTLQKDLGDFLRKIKALDYKIKLDSNGTNPEVLKAILSLIDLLAIDVKTELTDEEYKKFGLKTDVSPILKSLELAAKSGLPIELRTTIVPKLHDEKIIQKMSAQLAEIFKDRLSSPRHPDPSTIRHSEALGPKNLDPKVRWYLQTFRPGTCLDEKYNDEKPYSKAEMQKLLDVAKPIFPSVFLR